MADPLHVLLGRCCVSIQRNGTGFFVSPTQILTCAHVLDSRMPPSLPVGAEVDVMASDGTVRKARLARLVPEQDLALLTLDGVGGPAAILGEPDAELVEEERLLVLGFPAFDRSSRELASLSVRYDGSSDSTTRKRLQFKGNNVVGGFSGGPLLSLHTGRVVGMVTESREKRSTIGGWAIPTETIRELPDLGAAAGTDLAAWAQALEDRQGFIDLSSPGVQPVLRRLTESGSSALDFAARRIGFVGREAEMEGLKDF